jgi:predicted transcriptional regulator
MAKEIYDALRRGELDNAANLTKTTQVDSLAEWLVSL